MRYLFFRLCRAVVTVAFCLMGCGLSSVSAAERWWPVQKPAKELIVIDAGIFREIEAGHSDKSPAAVNPYAMLAQSLSGLAAQAVNEGKGDQLVWIAPRGSKSYAEWLSRLLNRTGMKKVKRGDLWKLVAEFQQKGLVKGYVLYRAETKSRDDRALPVNEKSGDLVDESCNVATVVAGLEQGILVDQSIEAEAKQAGLPLLFDARSSSEHEVFEKYKGQLNQRAILVQSPDFPYMRDLAIAQRMMVCFGIDSPTPEVYRWMKPIGAVFGWNVGDEKEGVLQATKEGHVLVPADWALNIPALSVGAPASLEIAQLPKFQTPASAASPVSKLPGIALVMSDGDNIQWMLTSFAHNPHYWGDEQRNERPLSWGLPLADLVHLAPDVYNYLVETQGPRTSILCHMGYYYPDLFADARGVDERKALLGELARQTQVTFEKTGTHFLTFLADELDSRGALESYDILAKNSPSLQGMFAIAYDPYEGGKGHAYWAKRDDGSQVPVTTAAYALWQTTAKKRPQAGTPGVLAEKILKTSTPGTVNWVIVHVWSEFAPPEGMPVPGGKYMGVGPTNELADKLKGKADILTAEELVKQLLSLNKAQAH